MYKSKKNVAKHFSLFLNTRWWLTVRL